MKYLFKKIITILWVLLITFTITWPSVFAWNNFWIALEEGSDTNKLWQDIDVLNQMEDKFTWAASGAEWIWNFIARIAIEVLIPVFVFIWVIFALIGFFKLMLAESSEEIWKASLFLLRWVIGIMVMVSAAYIVDQLVWVGNPWEGWIIAMITWWWDSWWAIAQHIYDKIFFPFLIMFIYIIIWIMFIFALINAFKYMFAADESTKSKSLISLSYAASWIVTIILAKSLVEIVYGNYSSVTDGANNLWEIWEWVINTPDFSILHTVINWSLGLVTFVVAITIIYQWYLLLVMPSDEKTIEKIKKDFWYIFIWILVIWLAYLIVNFFIIQKA